MNEEFSSLAPFAATCALPVPAASRFRRDHRMQQPICGQVDLRTRPDCFFPFWILATAKKAK
jgi:hypothetical protein